MPFTPLHFGYGAALHAAAPRRVSFLAFCLSNVLIDLEPLYCIVTDQDYLHGFFHTFPGATLVVLTTLGVFLIARQERIAIRIKDLFAWQSLDPRAVLGGAALGGWSHVVLDSVMHVDVLPFSPYSTASPLYGAISIEALHGSCLVCGVAGLLLVVLRAFTENRTTP